MLNSREVEGVGLFVSASVLFVVSGRNLADKNGILWRWICLIASWCAVLGCLVILDSN